MSSSEPASALTLPVTVCGTGAAIDRLLLDEIARALKLRSGADRVLVSLATGATFASFLPRLAEALRAGALPRERLSFTHLDEYLGFAPDRPGGMVHELGHACPALFDQEVDFVPVPAGGESVQVEAHRAALAERGGIALQLLGIGRNGHVGFNEPGSDPELSFRIVELAETTRSDARPRFAPQPVPERAVSAGLRDILAADRAVLVAKGAGKREVLDRLRREPEGPQLPASYLRRLAPARLQIFADREAAPAS